jgi:beta-ureidopropionase / N-carbamoyl-L-amino-acid hydrolase
MCPWPACANSLHKGRRLPFDLELVAFAEEEGQRYKATFLGLGRAGGPVRPGVAGSERCRWRHHARGHAAAGLHRRRHREAIAADPTQYLGFVEVHIEQGPVLNELNLPLGIVTSINGSVRYVGESHRHGQPRRHHPDGPPPRCRCRGGRAGLVRGKARRKRWPDSVGTVGMLAVPNGSINVVPGRCQFSLDMRATTDAQRDALERRCAGRLQAICERRGVRSHAGSSPMRAAAAPSHPAWQARWERAVAAQGLPLHRMPSGAGHDAMKLHELMPQAMLFVRGQNSRHQPQPAGVHHQRRHAARR